MQAETIIVARLDPDLGERFTKTHWALQVAAGEHSRVSKAAALKRIIDAGINALDLPEAPRPTSLGTFPVQVRSRTRPVRSRSKPE